MTLATVGVVHPWISTLRCPFVGSWLSAIVVAVVAVVVPGATVLVRNGSGMGCRLVRKQLLEQIPASDDARLRCKQPPPAIETGIPLASGLIHG